MTFFVEDPWTRVVAIHFEEDPEPTPGVPAYCGRYGYGAATGTSSTGIITSIPYGPNQLPPMTGTFSTTNATGPAGEQYGSLTGNPMHPTATLTAPGGGLVATSIFLLGNEITFTNSQLMFIQDVAGGYGTIGWSVPMATGNPTGTRPIVIKSYTIEMAWASHAGEEVAIGVSHPVPGHTGTLPRPTVPAAEFGTTSSGSATFVYDFKYAQWARGEIVVTPENQFDPNLGGPAILWWMNRRRNGDGSYTPWGAGSQFMWNIIIGHRDDHYTWEIIAECQLQPTP